LENPNSFIQILFFVHPLTFQSTDSKELNSCPEEHNIIKTLVSFGRLKIIYK